MLDFMGIGEAKTATTWLYENSQRHPDIEFPAGKAVHFWDRNRERGVDWWLGHFAKPSAAKQGEITAAYGILKEPEIRQIAALLPQVRLIYSIRNPIERVWSDLRMLYPEAMMANDAAAGALVIDHFKSGRANGRGDYAGCLDRWSAFFAAEKIQVVVFDDIVAEPKAVLSGLADHIGVDPEFFQHLPDSDARRAVHVGQPYHLEPQLLEMLREWCRPDVEAIGKRLSRDFSHWLEWDGRVQSQEAQSPNRALKHSSSCPVSPSPPRAGSTSERR